jgi:hypothetical protein
MKWNELDTEKQTIIRRLYAGEVLMADDVGHIPNFATQYSYYHHGWVISDEGKTFVKTGEWTRSLTADDTPEQAELAALREQVATLTRALEALRALPDGDMRTVYEIANEALGAVEKSA